MSTVHFEGTKLRDQELETLKANVEHLKNSRVCPAIELANVDQVDIPFNDAIIEPDFAYHVKVPTIDKYDGREDPENHLATFEWHINTLGVGQLGRCKLFHMYLSRVTIRWFRKFRNREIQTRNSSPETS